MSKDFPGLRWHPETGEAQVFKAAHEVPEGWLDHHPKDPAHADAPKAKPAAKQVDPNAPLSRKEVRAALDEGGIEYDKQAPTAELTALLDSKVREVLNANEISFPEEADVKSLLGLLPRS